MARTTVLTLVVVLLLLIGLLPVVVMFSRSLFVQGHISLAAYQGLLAAPREWMLLGHSFALAILTTALATAIGLPLGILLGKTDLPFRRGFIVLFTLPLLIPPYIIAISWFDILGRQGVVARLLGASAAQTTSAWLFGLPGCVLVLTTTFLPIVMLLTITSLRTVNPHLEEAGKLSAGWPEVLRRITLPLVIPGILLAAMLVFLLALGEFGVPTFLRFDVFSVESFTQFSAFYNFSAATAAAIPLALVTFALLVIERMFLRERTYQLQPAPDSEGMQRISLGPYRSRFLAVVILLSLVLVILPLLVLGSQSFSVNAYAEAISRAGHSLLRSLMYAAIGALLLSVLGFMVGYLVHTRALSLWRSVDSLTLFLFALPGTVIGIGLISLWNRPQTNFIYATPAIIALGYLAHYTVLTSRITVATLARIPPSMEEAAQIVGAKWPRRLTRVVAPLAGPGLIAGALVGYIFCLRDTGVTLLVYPPGHDTFAVRIFTLMANGAPAMIAALCMLMIVATLLPVGVVAVFFKKRWSGR